MSERRVVITGIGVVTPLGCDLETLWQNLLAGKSGIEPVTRFDATNFDCKIGGEVKDFKAELLYSVPKDVQGSWVNLCTDPKGRLIVSDQYGPLYRMTPPARGAPLAQTKVEKLAVPLGGAHGLLWAFDSLYVMVNEDVVHTGPNNEKIKPKHGLYRVRSRDSGDNFDKPELLREVRAGGEHGAHAILLAPDGKSLYVVCGNQSKIMNPLAGSRVPQLWGEDHLLPRMPDGNGFMAGVLGPGGSIYKVDPDIKHPRVDEVYGALERGIGWIREKSPVLRRSARSR